ncbi:MAG: DUF309 domain-containing protein [Planctomycetes bacterium]|nr:DUF309 domain-containing protein [Planctomycetota bacterium]
MPADEYPALYREGIRLFNEREFFACHDALEELWTETLGPERQFYQGLIHAAVALFHFSEGNLGGARKMYDSMRRYLAPYGPRYMGLDVESLLAQMRTCFRPLLEAREWPADATLDEVQIPALTLEEHRGTGR